MKTAKIMHLENLVLYSTFYVMCNLPTDLIQVEAKLN